MKYAHFLFARTITVFVIVSVSGCQVDSTIYGNYSSETCIQSGQNSNAKCANSGTTSQNGKVPALSEAADH